MSIISYYIIRLTRKGTINKLVVVRILLDNSKTEERILTNDVTRTGYYLKKQIGCRGRSLFTEDFLILKKYFG